MNEQPLNLRASLQEIWRRRLLIFFVAAICAAGGIAYGLLGPTKDTAIALVLLPANTASAAGNSGNSGNTGAAGNGINTNAVIAKSTPVLAAAGAKVTPRLGALGVKDLVTVTPLSSQILQIQAQARSNAYAVQLANAVAASYVTYIAQLEGSSAGAAVTALQHESSQLTKQINDLQSQINTVTARIALEGAASSAGQRDTDLLGSLRSEQNQVSLELNGVTSRITNAQLASGSTASTTRILQKATTQPVSKYKLPVEAAILGFVIGLLIGVVFVLVRLQRGRRLRLRDEIARIAGAPVVTSLEAPRCSTASDWRALLQEHPRATTAWALRHVLHSLPTAGGRRQRVRVISFAGDSAALTTGPRLALHAAGAEAPTALVIESSTGAADRSLTHLRAAFTGATPVGQGLPLTVGSSDEGEDQSLLLVSLVVFDGPSVSVTAPDAMNLLALSSNFATADEIAQLALAAADSGALLDGVIVVNPDPTDTTTGSTKDEAVQVFASAEPMEAGSSELVHLGVRTRQAGGGSPGRLTRQQRY